MNFRSSGSRFKMLRSKIDPALGSRRQEVVGFITKVNPSIHLAAGIELTEAERVRCERHIAQLSYIIQLQDALALASLPTLIEQIDRHLNTIEDWPTRYEAARSILFAAGELTRLAHGIADISDGDLAEC